MRLIAFELICICCSVSALSSYGQSISRQAIGPAGGSTVNSMIKVSSTTGEVTRGTGAAGDHIITQGFQQAELTEGPDGLESHGIASFKVYPNPTDGFFSVQLTRMTGRSTALRTRLISTGGNLLMQRSMGTADHTATYDISWLPSGQYLLILETVAGTLIGSMPVQRMK